MRRSSVLLALGLVLVPLLAAAQDAQRTRTRDRAGIDSRLVLERMQNPLGVEDCPSCVLGIFDDPGLTQRTGTITPFVPKDLYIGIQYTPPYQELSGLEFSIYGIRQAEDGILVTSVEGVGPVPPNLILGTIQAPADTSSGSSETGGVNVAWPTCVVGSQAVLKVTIVSFSPISEKVIWVKRKYPPSNPIWQTPIFTQCDIPTYTATRVTGGCYGLNFTGVLPCGTPPPNQPPVCDAGGPYTAPFCTTPFTSITLDGTGSFDPEGQPISYLWSTTCPGATIVNPTSAIATLQLPTPPGAVFNCSVSLVVDDGLLGSSCSSAVVVNCGGVNLPPVCDAGGPYNPLCTSPFTTVSLNGTGSFDPEGLPLSYQWSTTCPGAVIFGSNNPIATLQIPTPPGAVVNCDVSLVVGDGTSASACSSAVRVNCGGPNQPPVCDAGGPYTGTCAGPTTDIHLDGSGSFDPDPGDAITWSWTSDCPGASFDDPTSPTPTLTLDSRCCPIACQVTLVVSDGSASTTCGAPVTLTGGGPEPVTKVLWPPNHQYATIRPPDCVAGGCRPAGPATVRVVAVRSDEPEDAPGQGDGNTDDDIVIDCPDVVRLRAERQGNGDGRVYTITYEVTDLGGPRLVDCKVAVPHDQSGDPAVEGPGPGYSVAGTCAAGAPLADGPGRLPAGDGIAKAQLARSEEPGIAVALVLAAPGPVVLDVYDIAGRRVGVVRAELAAGSHVLRWNGRDLQGHEVARGIYLLQLRAGGNVQRSKVLWMR